MVRHVARRLAARNFQPRPSAIFRTPDFSTWVAGFVVGIPAGLLDIGTLADLSNIGTLFAFALVAGGVLILRYREPDRPRAVPRTRRAAGADHDDSYLPAADGRDCPS